MKTEILKIVIGMLIIFNTPVKSMEIHEINYNIVSGKTVFDGGYYKTSDTYWTGREWLKAGCLKSMDLVNWNRYTISGEMEEFIESHPLNYVWDGDSYIAYINSPDSEYIYRISSDFNEILEQWEMPHKIFRMQKVLNEYYIQTYDGLMAYSYKVYKSSDLTHWNMCEYDELPETNNSAWGIFPQYTVSQYINGFKPVVNTSNLSILYDQNIYGVKYEEFSPKRVSVSNGYYFSQYHSENSNLLCVSNDGVYWLGIIIPDNITNIVEVFEYGEDKIIAMSEQCENSQTIIYNLEFDKDELLSYLEGDLSYDTPHILLKNDFLGFSEKPRIYEDLTLVPMRFLFEQMGATVDWNAETQTATATLNDTAVTFAIDDTEATVNAQPTTMEVPAQLVNGKTMVPLRFLSEELGYTVTWDEETRTAIIE